MQALQAMGVAPSTRRTYQAGITRFLEFCCTFSLSPLPASPLTLRYFCAHISPAVCHSTVKLYLSAIRLYHIEHEHPDPTKDTLLQYVVKGIKRSQSAPTRPRLPITLSTLKALKLALHNSTHHSLHDKRMLWAAFTTAFYGFLRAGELCARTPSHFDPDSTLLHSDCTLTPVCVHLQLKVSKTDPFRQGHTVIIGATGTSTCPSRALQNYLALLQLTPSTPASPLFSFEDRSYLTRPRLTTALRSLLLTAGLNPDHYASHSFRIGAATSAAAAGLPDWQIQAMGRWSSDCYMRYIRTPQSTLIRAAQQLATQAEETPPHT